MLLVSCGLYFCWRPGVLVCAWGQWPRGLRKGSPAARVATRTLPAPKGYNNTKQHPSPAPRRVSCDGGLKIDFSNACFCRLVCIGGWCGPGVFNLGFECRSVWFLDLRVSSYLCGKTKRCEHWLWGMVIGFPPGVWAPEPVRQLRLLFSSHGLGFSGVLLFP